MLDSYDMYGEGIRARVCVWNLQDDLHIVTGVEVEQQHRGKGYAKQLLKRVCDDADREGVYLDLSVEPDGSPGSLDEDGLRALYRRFGFEDCDPDEFGPYAMQRAPQEAA